MGTGFARSWAGAFCRFGSSPWSSDAVVTEPVHIDRQFRWGHDFVQKHEFPSGELGAITQIEIFGQRVMLPATCFFDAGFSPESRSPIEIEEASATASSRLFKQQMSVQEHCLDPCQERITTI